MDDLVAIWKAAAQERGERIKELEGKLSTALKDVEHFQGLAYEQSCRLDSIRKYLAGQRATSEHEDEVYQAVSRLADPSAYYEPFVERQKS